MPPSPFCPTPCACHGERPEARRRWPCPRPTSITSRTRPRTAQRPRRRTREVRIPRSAQGAPMRHRLVVTVLALSALPPLGLRAEEDPHAACARMGWVPREILERPVALRSGLGNAHDPVTTSSKEAQAFYDQGVNYLHGYVWIEAARSFRQALRLDPKLAMAWVGLSRVSSGLDDPEEARRALAQAEALASGASPREQRRIAARAAQ